MARRTLIAALAATFIALTAGAEGRSSSMNLGLLHWIRDTTCTSGREIVFIPVSHDVKTRKKTYAVVPADNLQASSAHVVTKAQARWLASHGCRTADAPQIIPASVRSRQVPPLSKYSAR